MKRINLRELYPQYTLDCYIHIPDDQYEACLATLTKEIADVYIEFARAEDTWNRQRSRYGAFYSLDAEKGIEKRILQPVQSPEQIYEKDCELSVLHAALSQLPEKQGQRIYAHYFLKMSRSAIARKEGVHESSIRESILHGLRRLKMKIK